MQKQQMKPQQPPQRGKTRKFDADRITIIVGVVLFGVIVLSLVSAIEISIQYTNTGHMVFDAQTSTYHTVGVPLLLDQLNTSGVPILVSLAAVSALTLLSLVYASAKRHSHPRSTHGSARYATLAELQEAGFIYPPTEGNAWLELGTMNKKRHIGLDERTQHAHVLLVAPTRKGKTTGMIIPNLLQETGTRSVFINDLKGELISVCIGALSQRLTCRVFAPTQPRQTQYYNPLAYVESQEDARDVAECIIQNTGESQEEFWNNIARVMITAAILHVKARKKDAPFKDVVNLLTELSYQEMKDTFTTSPSSQAQRLISALLAGLGTNERLLGSVITDISVRLADLKAIDVETVTSKDELDLDAQNPFALFLSIPADESKRLKWLSSCLTMQLMKRIVRRSNTQEWAFYLDELANMGYIPNYLQYISYIGGFGVTLVQVIQDFGQLKRIYNDDGFNTIVSNSNTQVVYPGCGLVETRHYSEVAGDTTVKFYSSGISTSGQGGSYTTTDNYTQRRLMTPDEIRTMPKGTLLVLVDNVHPFKVNNWPYFERPDLSKLAKLPYMFPLRYNNVVIVEEDPGVPPTQPLQQPGTGSYLSPE